MIVLVSLSHVKHQRGRVKLNLHKIGWFAVWAFLVQVVGFARQWLGSPLSLEMKKKNMYHQETEIRKRF